VDAAVIKVTGQSRSRAALPLWKHFGHERRDNILYEVLRVERPLWSHQINQMKALNTSDDGSHRFCDVSSPAQSLRHIIATHTPFRGVLKFKCESALITCYKVMEIHALEY
jgi:hypothetical protein